MDIWQSGVMVLIVVLLPILDRRELAALRCSPSECARVAVYRRGALTLWIATAAVCMAGQGWQIFLVRSPVVELWRNDHSLLACAAVLIACAFFLVNTMQGLACLHDAARRKRIAPAFAPMRYLLPASRLERRWWVLLSLTAGICEELLYRGFLLHCLLVEWPGGFQLGLLPAWLLGALAFGLAHLYQGWRGMLASTVMGLVFGVLAIGTGSLFLPIMLHAVIDMQVLWMYRPDLDGDAETQHFEDIENFRA